MKIRQTIKKAVALGTGALMLGATILGASATSNVSDYPSAFIKDGKVNAKIVVGEKAMVSDVVGAIDIAADLQSKAVSKTTISTGGNAVSVSGGKTEESNVDSDLSSEFGVLDNSDIKALFDGTVSIDINADAEDFDAKETINVSTVSVETGLTSTSPDEKFEDKVFLEVPKDSVRYRYTFTDALNNGHFISNATSDDPVEIDFLGKNLKITGATATSITVEIGQTEVLNAGDSVKVGTHTVKLVKCGADSAVVDVDGTVLTISTGNTKTSGGLRVKVDTVFNDDGTQYDSATLIIGEDVSKTYQNDDEYIGENKDDPAWVWVLSGLTGTTPVLGVDNNHLLDNYDEVLYAGDKLDLPNGYASVYLDSMNQASTMQDYTIMTDVVDLKDSTGDNSITDSAHVLVFESKGGNDDGFLIDSHKTDKVYGYYNSSVGKVDMYWKDKSDSKIKRTTKSAANATTTNNLFSIEYKDTTINVDATLGAFGASADWTLRLASNVTYNTETTSNNFDYVGESDSDTTVANDVLVGARDISGWEKATRTAEGVVLASYKDSDSADEYHFSVPVKTSDYKANVVVMGNGGSAQSSASGSVTTDKVNPIGVDFGVLDSNAPAAGSANLIVVGGPCVNTVAARLAGNPANCVEGFVEGEAKLSMFDDSGKVALLVAGYSAADTQGATRALINEVLPTKSSAALTTVNSKMPKFK